MKPTKKHSILPVVSSQLTATVSVTLVLFVLGLLALLGIAAHRATTAIKEQIGFVVIMNDNATAAELNAMKAHWVESDRVSSVKYASADEVLRRWNEQMGIDPDGEGDPALDGINPFLPEFEVNVRAEYAHPDSVEAIADTARGMGGVREIKLNPETAESVAETVNGVLAALAAIAAVLLVISVALINNTIRLTIYSRRFLIHTMRLVGATAGFIRRPFVSNSMVSGLIAAAIAIAALAGVTAWVMNVEPEIRDLLPLSVVWWVALGMLLAGVTICSLSAVFATNKYIGLRYDEMFR